MAKALTHVEPKRSPMVPVYKESPLDPYGYDKKNSPFNLLTNAKQATVSATNKLQQVIKHVGRAKESGGNTRPS